MMTNKYPYTLRIKGSPIEIATPCRVGNANSNGLLVDFTAVWDTGATTTLISERVVRLLNLQPIGYQSVHTTTNMAGEVTKVYLVAIQLPNSMGFPMIPVIEGQTGVYDVLIGMDIINYCDLAITHKDGNTVFSIQIPSTHDIDFENEA